MDGQKRLERTDGVFIGREKELEQLNEHLRSVKEGDGRLVFVSGEAGVGKSYVIEQFIKEGKNQYADLKVFRGRCLYTDSPKPFPPFIEAFEDYIKEKGGGVDKEDIKTQPKNIGVAAIAEEDNEMEDFEISISDKREIFFSKITSLLQRFSEEAPVILYLEDLHMLDESSSYLLHHLARNLSDHRVLILGTYRPEELMTEEDDLPLEVILDRTREEGLRNEIELDRFDRGNIQRIIEGYLDWDDYPEMFFDKVYQESEGNPDYALEMLESWEEEGLIQKNERAGITKAEIEELTTPELLTDLITRRIDQLDKEKRKLVEYAATMGTTFDFEVLEDAMDMDVVRLLDIMDELMAMDLIEEVEERDREIYRFTHVQIRNNIYQSMGKSRKRVMHNKIGKEFEKVYSEELDEHYYDLSDHFYKGNIYDKAYRYSKKAGEESAKSLAIAVSIEYYERALDALRRCGEVKDEEEKEKELLEKIAEYSFDISKWKKSLKAWEELKDLIQDEKSLLCRVHRKIGTIHKEFKEYDKAEKNFNVSITLANEIESEEQLAKSNLGLGLIDWRKGNLDDALKHYSRAAVIGDRMEREEILADAYLNIGAIYAHQGDFELATQFEMKSLDIYQEEGIKKKMGRCYNNIGDTYLRRGEHEDALGYFEQTISVGEELGNQKITAWGHFNRAQALANIGRTDKASKAVKKAQRILKKINHQVGIAACERTKGMIERERGRYNKAIEHFKESLKDYSEPDVPFGRARCKFDLGTIYKMKGNHDRAKDYLEDSVDIFDRLGSKVFKDRAKNELSELDTPREENS